jgi:hypothetical protein
LKFKKIVTSIAFLICFSSNIVSAHYYDSLTELQIGYAAANEYKQKYHTYYAYDVGQTDITDIQEHIVNSNPDHLSFFNDRKHKRHLDRIQVSTEPTVNGFSFPGGFTFITKDMIDMINTVRDDGYTDMDHMRNNKRVNIYNNGTIAFVMAHEFAHFANEDYLRKTDKQMTTDILFSVFGGTGDVTKSMIEDQAHTLITDLNTKQMSLRTEEQADSTGLKFIDKTSLYSIGNAAIFFHRLEALQSRQKVVKDKSNPHSSTELRLQRVLDQIKDDSKGRIEIKNDRLFVDGKLFMGTGLLPAKDNVTALDRTYYVAGQLATLIKYDLLKKEKMFLTTPGESWKADRNYRIIIVGEAKPIPRRKVLDVFNFNNDEYKNAITKTDEMLYYDEMIKLCNNGK